ncbi:hypothetical protein AA0472_1486 [Acetobacter estunensis NRIC 0472]|uniref:Lipoprotein n=1 Tax=Acetobacter estunensis TaxID=104097 RepID=A0A967B622_9PROT|nr:hypothetical protein [Acetobacter estunensis]NHO53074.1 hypothetical protein [Acetobacter estunensis]GBQ24635.1 hypothetical protein AA0472_1486 [Acetobacter estunensis NRIC 0472]
MGPVKFMWDKQMRLNIVFALGSMVMLSACSHSITLSGTGASASEVMPNRIIQTPTQYSYTQDLTNASKSIEPESASCAAHTYKLSIGPGIKETLDAAISAGFAKATETHDGEVMTAPYNMRIDAEDISARISVIPRMFSSRVEAHVEITGRVDVRDAQGTPAARAMIYGEGTESADGGCFNAETAIHLAGDKAIRRLGTDFVYKVINSNILH